MMRFIWPKLRQFDIVQFQDVGEQHMTVIHISEMIRAVQLFGVFEENKVNQ